ncbi:nucleotidyltransferase domain-containing protein [Nanoarchaeota archaeon]
MLKFLNSLSPFIEDNYQELGVREYARIVGVSPPTASKILSRYEVEGLLISRKDRKYIFYRANRESMQLLDLTKVYWRTKAKQLVEFLKEEFVHANITLFGSLTKLETKNESDIDLYVDARGKSIDLGKFERKMKRKIQLQFKNAMSNRNLKRNVDRGVVL